jgi:microcystin-dependent protein
MSYNILTGNTYLSATAPTGSLSAYLASTDPVGWVICDGQPRGITDNRYFNVVSLGIGSTAGLTIYTPPNLRGSFLRGIGTATNTNYVGPSVMAFQQQQIINHGHAIGSHSHTSVDFGTTFYAFRINTAGSNTANSVDSSANEPNIINNGFTLNSQNTGSGSLVTTNSVAAGVAFGTETRPYNYGVNWILKL